MAMRIFLLLIAFSLSACTKIRVDDAVVKNNDRMLTTKKLPEFKILNNKAREAVNATNPDDLIAVFTKDGVIFYGSPGKAFKIEPDERNPDPTNKSKINGKEPVNSVVIETFVNSPLCQSAVSGGDRIWYPSGCPH